MSFNALTNHIMLAHSDALLGTPALRAKLDAHPLGAVLTEQLQIAHDDLAEKQTLREQTNAVLADLGDDISALDHDHDRFARGFHWHLGALAECAETPEEVDMYLDLQARLFPHGLNVVRLSYLAEAGAIVELEKRVTPEMLAQLAEIPVGTRTLADIYHAWVAAGKALGRKVRERAQLQESTTGDGTAAASLDTRVARRGWIRIVSALMSTIDLIPMSSEDREAIIGPIEQSLRTASRSRGGSNDSPDQEPEPVPGDGADDGEPAVDGIGTSPVGGGGGEPAVDGIGTSPIPS